MADPSMTKVSIFYDYKGRGFSETLWALQTLENGRDQVRNYLTLRMAMADDDCRAVYARISDPTVPRKVIFIDLKSEGWAGKRKEDGSLPDDCVDVRMVSEKGTSHLFLHAFPKNFIKEDVLVPDSRWANAFKEWGAYLQKGTNGWGMRNGGGNIPANRVKMRTVTAKLPRGFSFTTVASSGLARGDTIAIGGSGSAIVGVRGRKIVTDVSADGKTVDVGGASPVGIVADDTAYFAKITYTNKPFTLVQARGVTERKTGRPFGLPPGRRANTLSLRR